MLVRQLSSSGGEFVGKRIDSALTLNQLQNNSRSASSHGAFQGGDVVRRHEFYTRQQRLEIRPVFGLSGDRERPERPSVERIVQGDNFIFVRVLGTAVRPRHFETTFDGLRPGISEKRTFQPADARQTLRQWTLIGVVVQV